MRKALHIVMLMLPVVLMATGCDFMRRLAGRPTSEDIQEKSQVIALEKAAAKALQDSLDRVAKHLADSTAAVDSLMKENAIQPSRFGGLKESGSKSRYYIIIGAFSNKSNADRYAADITAKGFPAETIPFRNGFTGVGVCGSDDIVRIRSSFKEVKRQSFCPEGVWILENKLQ